MVWVVCWVLLCKTQALVVILGNHTDAVSFEHRTAGFGPQPGKYSVASHPVVGIPHDGCSSFPSSVQNKIVMVQRGNCSFATKAHHAQLAGAAGMVVGNTEYYPNTLVIMAWTSDAGSSKTITIPCTFVLYSVYQSIVNALEGTLPVTLVMDGTGEIDLGGILGGRSSVLRYLSMFVMSLPSLWGLLALALLCRRRQQVRAVEHQRRHVLVTIPEIRFTQALLDNREAEHWLTNSACPICLDEFEESVLIKRLDCSHGFHASCIDPWLANRSDQCPICKRSILSSPRASSLSISSRSWWPWDRRVRYQPVVMIGAQNL